MSKNKLQPIRDQIDAIDLKLLRLIQKRGVLAQKVGEIKGLFENNSSLYRPDREAEILRNLIKLTPLKTPHSTIEPGIFKVFLKIS